MMKQLIGSSHDDISAHKKSALPTVQLHIEHGNEDVSIAAIRCMTTLSDSIGDSTAEICHLLLMVMTADDGQGPARYHPLLCVVFFVN